MDLEIGKNKRKYHTERNSYSYLGVILEEILKYKIRERRKDFLL